MAIRFNGVDQGYYASTAFSDVSGDLTQCMWFRLPASGSFGDNVRLLKMRGQGSENAAIWFNVGTEFPPISTFFRDAGVDSYPDPSSIDWVLYVIRRSGGTVSLGACVKNESVQFSTLGTANFDILRSNAFEGVQLAHSRVAGGSRDSFSECDFGGYALYAAVLSDAEIGSIASGTPFVDVQGASLVDSFDNPSAFSVLSNAGTGTGELTIVGTPTTIGGPFEAPATQPPQGTVTLDEPADASQQSRPNISLAWSYDDNDQDSFDVQVARDSGFTVLQVDVNTPASPFDTAFELDNDLTYHWRVRARNADGVSAWSSVRTFDTDTSPLQVTRVDPGIAVLSASDVSSETIYYFKVYDSHDFPEVETFGSRYFCLWSTDHGPNPGGIFWGTFDNLDLSDFVERGVILDGTDLSEIDRIETPFAVRNPSDPDSLTLYIYYRQSGPKAGTPATALIRLAGGILHEASIQDDGIVMPHTEGKTHTGYRTVERRSLSDWHAWGLASPGSDPIFDYRTSDDGFTWNTVSDLDPNKDLPSDKRFDFAQIGWIGEIAGETYIASFLTDDDSSGDSSAGSSPAIIRWVNDQTPLGPHYVLLDLENEAVGAETDNMRSIDIFVDDDDRAHMYYQTDQNLFYATSGVDAVDEQALPVVSRELSGAPDATNLRFAIHDRATPSPYIIESGTDGVVSAEVFQRSVGAGLKPGDAAYVVVTDTDGNPASETNAFAGPMGVE